MAIGKLTNQTRRTIEAGCSRRLETRSDASGNGLSDFVVYEAMRRFWSADSATNYTCCGLCRL